MPRSLSSIGSMLYFLFRYSPDSGSQALQELNCDVNHKPSGQEGNKFQSETVELEKKTPQLEVIPRELVVVRGVTAGVESD